MEDCRCERTPSRTSTPPACHCQNLARQASVLCSLFLLYSSLLPSSIFLLRSSPSDVVQHQLLAGYPKAFGTGLADRSESDLLCVRVLCFFYFVIKPINESLNLPNKRNQSMFNFFAIISVSIQFFL
jgi:hypothetical protein